MKRITALLLSLVMLFNVSLPVNATETTDESYVNLTEESVIVYLYEGNTHTLNYETNVEGIPTWESSEQTVATVEDGVVTPLAEGTTTVTVTVGEVSDTCEVVVAEPTLEVTNDEIVLYVGSQEKIEVETDVEAEYITFTSDDTSIATVDENGTVTGVSVGVVEIGVEAPGCDKETVTVRVVNGELQAPTVSTSRGADGITVTWNKVTGASKYELYRKVGSGNWKLIKTTTTGRSYLDKSLTWGSKHSYKVKAYGTSYGLGRESEYSNTSYKTVNSLYAPEKFTVKRSGYTSIKLTWSRSYPAKGYKVYRATSKNGTYKLVKTITSGSTLSYKDTGLKTGTTYYYKVRATYNSTNGKFTSVKSATPLLAAPTMKTTASSTRNSITVKWNKVSGANGYNVYRRASSSDSWKYIGRVTSGSTLSYKDSKASGRYYYSVKAYKNVDGKKVAGLRSEAIRSRTLKTTTVTVTSNANKLTNTVKWNKVTGATSYQVYRKVGSSGEWKLRDTVDGDVLKYTGSVPHGYYIHWKIRPVYKYDGVKTYGPYSQSDDNWIIYYDPEYSVWMSSDTDVEAHIVAMAISNDGVGNMRVYSKNAYYSQPGYSNYDRDVYMIDVDALENGKIRKISYVDIKPGETEYIVFAIDGEPTWYDEEGVIWYEFRYDGMYYEAYSSVYYGSRYSLKE